VEVVQTESVLETRIVPFGAAEARLAAELFNKTGRRRGSRFDCLIAATAILSQADVATVNQADFKAFVPHGLKLATPPPPLPPAAGN
jgi:predicted nucleic acid-binding protein